MIERLIFDVDGTLMTGVNFISAIENTLKRLGVYSEKNVLLFLKSISLYEKYYNNYNKVDYTDYFEKVLGIPLGDKFLNILFDELKKCVPHKNDKLQGCLNDLSKKYELVLLTNYFKESQLNRLCAMGISDLFLECYGEELIKPNKEIFLRACDFHNPEKCIMIGDNLFLDIFPAKEIGINTILVNSNGLNFEDLDTFVVDSVEEISVDLIESMVKTKKLR